MEPTGGDKFIDYAIELENYKRSRELSPVEREMLALAIFAMAMKIGPPSFASFESIAKKTGCLIEYLGHAESWIAYNKKEKGL
jgi:hypothetical protein